MCGILGFSDNKRSIDIQLLNSMRDAISHRGPDDAGGWLSQDKTIGFAHRRLSIIDLSASGHQPMADSTGKFAIVLNGEIYNYRELRAELAGQGHSFRSQSDTEVVLEAYKHWGEDFLQKLNGMFAFALYDSVQNIVLLARDRAGEKPLFYWHTGDAFVFASELKALMQNPSFPRVLDHEGMNFYLTYGYIPRDKCILKGVKKLPQGHALVLNRSTNSLKSWAYWTLPKSQNTGMSSPAGLVQELETLLTDSVKRQLVSDVPVGILLSGGIDSSLITAIASGVSPQPVKTFTISFPGHGDYDEAPYAKIVADYFGTQHSVLPAEAATVDLLPQLAAQFDEPLADSSMIPTYLVSKLVRKHATVAVGGDGGDELFGGYLHYPWLQHQARVRKVLPEGIRAALAYGAEALLPTGLRGRNYLQGLRGETRASFAFVNRFFDCNMRRDIFRPFNDYNLEFFARSESYKAELPLPGQSVTHQGMAMDFMTYLPDDILAKVDRASMLSSLEVRAPFLDYRLIEFAFSKVPDSFRVAGHNKKILPRMLAKKLLPASLDMSRKQGFAIPISKWLKGEWGDYMKSVLLASDSCFDKTIVRELFASQSRGLANSQRLFALTMFELWRKIYKISF